LFALHQFLIGLRRRHPWLHTAATTGLKVDNRQYVYETRCGDQALIVALNIDDKPMAVECAGLVVGGSGAPPQERVQHAQVPAHGWLILQP
jgi:hypothetical protein